MEKFGCVLSMLFCRALRQRLERFGPYPSLLILAIPIAVVEPFKLVAVLIAGGGHFLTGLVFLIFAYVVSLVVTERLFIVLKPKLLMLPWFAKSWWWFVALRRRALRGVRSFLMPAGKFLSSSYLLARAYARKFTISGVSPLAAQERTFKNRR
jgi:hypothetical protein